MSGAKNGAAAKMPTPVDLAEIAERQHRALFEDALTQRGRTA